MECDSWYDSWYDAPTDSSFESSYLTFEPRAATEPLDWENRLKSRIIQAIPLIGRVVRRSGLVRQCWIVYPPHLALPTFPYFKLNVMGKHMYISVDDTAVKLYDAMSCQVWSGPVDVDSVDVDGDVVSADVDSVYVDFVYVDSADAGANVVADKIVSAVIAQYLRCDETADWD